MVSDALGAGSACGAIERPRVSGFFCGGASARTISSSVTFLLLPSSPANAGEAGSDSAAPMAMMDRIAVSPFAADLIASPSCAAELRGSKIPAIGPPGKGRLRHPSISLAWAAEVRGVGRLNSKKY
ncbi:hypothetical protein ABIE88_001587 [Bradyrhizobium diazoefficiens]